MNAARTDEVFPEYLIEKETDIAAANQNITNSSLQGNSAPHKLPDGNSKEASKEALTLRGGEGLLCVRGGWLAFRQMDRLRRQLDESLFVEYPDCHLKGFF